MDLRSSPDPMSPGVDGHTPQTLCTPGGCTPNAAPEKSSDPEANPWPRGMYKRAMNWEYSTHDLPKPVAQALDAWMKASQATAIITALLAGVQAGMIAIIESMPESNDSTLWRTFRAFVYAGVCFDLGATLSSVYITVQGASLPVLARRKAMAEMDDLESAPYPYHLVHNPGRMIPHDRLDGWHGLQLLEEFGIGKFWTFVAFHMLWSFVLGYICLIMSIILWVCAREVLEMVVLIVLIAVGTAIPVYGFLRPFLPI